MAGIRPPRRGPARPRPPKRAARSGWPRWKHVALSAPIEEIGDDRLLALAAGVVFYGLLALFPAITALVSSYALFASAADRSAAIWRASPA